MLRPIGWEANKPFKGEFDGNGFTISGLDIAENGVKTLLTNTFNEYIKILKYHFDHSDIKRIDIILILPYSIITILYDKFNLFLHNFLSIHCFNFFHKFSSTFHIWLIPSPMDDVS